MRTSSIFLNFIRVLFLPLPFMAACVSAKIENCSIEKATEVADLKVKKGGYKLNTLNRTITVYPVFYDFYYSPKDSNVRGNSARIFVDKKKCIVIGIRYYQ